MNPVPQKDLESLFGCALADQLPFNVAVIDRDFRIVKANRSFEEFFGEWQGKHCYEVYKRSSRKCDHCLAQSTFQDGAVRVSDETGADRHGRPCHYVVHVAPLTHAEDGSITHILEMTTDVTAPSRWQREYDLFFERVPCYVSVIDRDFRIVRANKKFRERFGETEGRYCYEVWKRRAEPCAECPALLTFQDGGEHLSEQTGLYQDGSTAHYMVSTAPLSPGEPGAAHVIEMATDMTDVRRLEHALLLTHTLYEVLIAQAATGILALDNFGHTRIMNPAARELLGWNTTKPPDAMWLRSVLPPAFSAWRPGDEGLLNCPDTTVRNVAGESLPVHVSAVPMAVAGGLLGYAVFLEDLRELKRLEQEKLDAERLGAVGQTVSGLAHTIKNLLMGLEGGMYILNTGIRRGDPQRIQNGLELLQRNFDKTTTLVKDFLSFAKGRVPEMEMIDPNALAGHLVDLYSAPAKAQAVDLLLEADPGVEPAPLDPHAIETCLTNLISNGVDAATMREEGGGRVVVRTAKANGELVFEVEDNGCGIEGEAREKLFTTFFTTKGAKGTGLGLLITRRIVQEHGGRLEVESAVGSGSTFRIRLPRKRLAELAAKREGES